MVGVLEEEARLLRLLSEANAEIFGTGVSGSEAREEACKLLEERWDQIITNFIPAPWEGVAGKVGTSIVAARRTENGWSRQIHTL